MYTMMTDEEILAHINAGRYITANVAIQERILATGVKEKVVTAAMHYAWEHGHSAGDDEVSRIAFNLLTDVFDPLPR